MITLKKGADGKPELWKDGQKILGGLGFNAAWRPGDDSPAIHLAIKTDDLTLEDEVGDKTFLKAVPEHGFMLQLGDALDPLVDVEGDLPTPWYVPEGTDILRFWTWAKYIDPTVKASNFPQTGMARIKAVFKHLQTQTGKSASLILKHWNVSALVFGWALPADAIDAEPVRDLPDGEVVP